MNCIKCFKVIPDDLPFCGYCGKEQKPGRNWTTQEVQFLAQEVMIDRFFGKIVINFYDEPVSIIKVSGPTEFAGPGALTARMKDGIVRISGRLPVNEDVSTTIDINQGDYRTNGMPLPLEFRVVLNITMPRSAHLNLGKLVLGDLYVCDGAKLLQLTNSGELPIVIGQCENLSFTNNTSCSASIKGVDHSADITLSGTGKLTITKFGPGTDFTMIIGPSEGVSISNLETERLLLFTAKARVTVGECRVEIATLVASGKGSCKIYNGKIDSLEAVAMGGSISVEAQVGTFNTNVTDGGTISGRQKIEF